MCFECVCVKHMEANGRQICERSPACECREPASFIHFMNESIHSPPLVCLGKTTLLNVMLGKTDPSWKRGGSLTVNTDSRDFSFSHYRKLFGFVPQVRVCLRLLVCVHTGLCVRVLSFSICCLSTFLSRRTPCIASLPSGRMSSTAHAFACLTRGRAIR